MSSGHSDARMDVYRDQVAIPARGGLVVSDGAKLATFAGVSNEVYQELGSVIRRFRIQSNLTQQELGRRIGRSRTAITNIEAGRQRVPVDVLLAIADAVSVNACTFLDGLASTEASLTPAEVHLYGLPIAARRKVLQALQEREGFEDATV